VPPYYTRGGKRLGLSTAWLWKQRSVCARSVGCAGAGRWGASRRPRHEHRGALVVAGLRAPVGQGLTLVPCAHSRFPVSRSRFQFRVRALALPAPRHAPLRAAFSRHASDPYTLAVHTRQGATRRAGRRVWAPSWGGQSGREPVTPTTASAGAASTAAATTTDAAAAAAAGRVQSQAPPRLLPDVNQRGDRVTPAAPPKRRLPPLLPLLLFGPARNCSVYHRAASNGTLNQETGVQNVLEEGEKVDEEEEGEQRRRMRRQRRRR